MPKVNNICYVYYEVRCRYNNMYIYNIKSIKEKIITLNCDIMV